MGGRDCGRGCDCGRGAATADGLSGAAPGLRGAPRLHRDGLRLPPSGRAAREGATPHRRGGGGAARSCRDMRRAGRAGRPVVRPDGRGGQTAAPSAATPAGLRSRSGASAAVGGRRGRAAARSCCRGSRAGCRRWSLVLCRAGDSGTAPPAPPRRGGSSPVLGAGWFGCRSLPSISCGGFGPCDSNLPFHCETYVLNAYCSKPDFFHDK